jgi:hypothetical protein
LDPGSEIRDPGWVKIRIRYKHPGSATLQLRVPKVAGPRITSVLPIRIRIRVKNLFRICIKIKIQELSWLKIEPWRAVDAQNGGLESL